MKNSKSKSKVNFADEIIVGHIKDDQTSSLRKQELGITDCDKGERLFQCKKCQNPTLLRVINNNLICQNLTCGYKE